MDEGQDWLKLHRRILENDFLMHDQTAFFVFMRLLLMAGKVKGEWSGSIRELADRYHLDMNYMTLYKALKRLENQQIIKQSNKQRYTLISICNWSVYQERRVTTKVTHGKHTGNTRVTHGKQPTPVTKNTEEKRIEKNKVDDDFFEKEIEEFVKFRKSMKKPLTEHGQELLIENLEKLYEGDRQKQGLCLQQSIVNGWIGVFPLKDNVPQTQQLKIEQW